VQRLQPAGQGAALALPASALRQQLPRHAASVCAQVQRHWKGARNVVQPPHQAPRHLLAQVLVLGKGGRGRGARALRLLGARVEHKLGSQGGLRAQEERAVREAAQAARHGQHFLLSTVDKKSIAVFF
jgi:hypothetical protein